MLELNQNYFDCKSKNLFETKIQGQSVVFYENQGMLRAAKQVGNLFHPLILSGLDLRIRFSTEKGDVLRELKDSFFQLIGPTLMISPRLKGGAQGSPPMGLLNDPQGLKEWFQTNPQVTELNLSGKKLGAAEAQTIASALPFSGVTSLNLANNNIGVPGTKILAGCLPFSKLTSLSLAYNSIGVVGAQALAQALPSSQIEQLYLNNCNVGIAGAEAIASALPSSKVTYLEFCNNGLGDLGAEAIASVLPLSKITWLFLQCNRIGKEGAQLLARALTSSNVTSFGLGGNEIGDEGAIAISKLLQYSKVTTLYLYGNEIGDIGLKAIAKALPLSKIEDISMANNPIRDAGFRAIAEILASSAVTVLNLHDTDMRDLGAQALASALPSSKITVLDLSNNQIGTPGAQAIANALPLSQVIELNIQRNSIGPIGAQAFANALPSTKLTALNISHNGIKLIGAQAIVKSLSSSVLNSLKLNDNKITNAGLIALSDALRLSQMIKLSLAGNSIEADGAKFIAQALPGSKVTQLNLARNLIGVKGAQAIADVLPFSNLTTLKLQNSHLGNPGVKALADVLHSSNVTSLNLKKNGIGAIGVQALVNALPSSKVTTLFLDDNGIKKNLLDLIRTHLGANEIKRDQLLESRQREEEIKKNLELVEEVSISATNPPLSPSIHHIQTAPPEVEVPDDFRCVLTLEIFSDPVITSDGHTYEREWIERHLQNSNKSPLTNVPLEHRSLIPNIALRKAIAQLIGKYPELDQQRYLTKASQEASLQALRAGNAQQLKNLLQDKRLLNCMIDNGKTLLDLACSATLDLLKTVIEAHIEPPKLTHELCAGVAASMGSEGLGLLMELLPKMDNWPDLSHSLSHAMRMNAVPYASALLKMGGNPNIKFLETSALHLAVELKNEQFVSLLLEYGANAKIKDGQGRTPGQLATEQNNPGLAQYIERKRLEVKMRFVIAPLMKQLEEQSQQIQELTSQVEVLTKKVNGFHQL